MSTAEPSWELYETFLSVMTAGSLSGASRSLRVAQPTIRRRIASLEESLGVVLFTRAPNGLVPTDAAHATLPHAETMAVAAHALVRSTSGPLEAERGTVRVTSSVVVGLEVLPPLLGPLRERFPGIQLELTQSNRLEDLLRRDADVAVRMVAPTQQSLVARKVGVVPIGLYAHARYLDAHPPPRNVEQLKAHSLIGADRDRAFLQGLAAMGLNVTARDLAIRTDNDVAQLAALRAGLGIGVCQVPIARGEPELKRVLPRLEFPLEMWVVMHEDQRAVRRVRAVFEHLVSSLSAWLSGETVRQSKERPR